MKKTGKHFHIPRAGAWAVICFLFTATASHAQWWSAVGATGFTGNEADFPAIAVDTAGIPYVVFMDYSHSKKATVMKYNETTGWVAAGSPGISSGPAYNTTIAFDKHTNTPYIAYMDAIMADRAVVMKFDGSSWIPVGTPGFTANEADHGSLAIDNNGTPYLAFEDYNNNKKATVMKYADTGWAMVGMAGFSDSTVNYVSLAIDPGGTPYVAYQDFGRHYAATVMKYNGSAWTPVGSPGISDSNTYYNSLAIDGNGIPYLAFLDVNAYGATVMQYLAGSWQPVGYPDFTFGGAYYIALALDRSGAPYIAYTGEYPNYQANVMNYSPLTDWNTLGNSDFSFGPAYYMSAAIDKHNDVYVAYQDASAPSNSITVMEYQNPNAVKTVPAGARTLSVFPNPAKGTFTLNIPAAQNEAVTIVITNALGEQVKTINTTTNTETAVPDALPAGVYAVTATTAAGTQCTRLVIE